MSIDRQKVTVPVIFLALTLVLVSCSSDAESETAPLGPEVESIGAAHVLPPTDEMMEIARSQCEDGREQGIVELVRPGSDEVVSRAVVDCR